MLRACRAVTGVLLLVPQTTGCTSWRAVPQPWPAEIHSSRTDPRIRVTLTDGTRLVADSGRALADSVVAYKTDFVHFIPLVMIRKVETRRFDALKSVPLFLGVGLIWAAVACSQICDLGGYGGGGGCSYFCGTPSVDRSPDAD